MVANVALTTGSRRYLAQWQGWPDLPGVFCFEEYASFSEAQGVANGRSFGHVVEQVMGKDGYWDVTRKTEPRPETGTGKQPHLVHVAADTTYKV